MVKLNNIRLDENTVKCEIYPENSKASGYIEIDSVKAQITKSALPVGYEWCKAHLAHAEKYIIEHIPEIKEGLLTAKS